MLIRGKSKGDAMSFTTDVKNELCGCDLSRRQEKILLYGFMYCLKSSREFFTESAAVKDFIRHICQTHKERKTVVTPQKRRGRDGFLIDLSKMDFDNDEIPVNPKYVNGQDENTGLFLRGAFIACGIVTDPDKEYHLEFSVGSEEKCREVGRIINESGMKCKISSRKGRYIAYTKDSESISDILTFIGAMISSMEIMNAKIYKGVRNNVNRAVNCEAANIDKTVAASRKQIEDIELIESAKGIGILSDELRIIARLRRDNPEASLSEIGKLAVPEISRSGVYHRLKRIGEIAERLRCSENENK